MTSAPPSSKAELISQISSSRLRLQAALDAFDDPAAVEPVLADGWSIKDVMAHIAEWELYVVRRIEARARSDTPEVWGSNEAEIDATNERLFARNKDRSLEDVERFYQEAHERLLEVIESLSEADLLDDSRREDVIGPWRSPVWMHIGGNTFWHYEEHAEAVEAYRAGLNGPSGLNAAA
jgi:hypothetical protein